MKAKSMHHSMFGRTLALLLTAAMLFGLISGVGMSAYADEEDVLNITSQDEFDAFVSDVNTNKNLYTGITVNLLCDVNTKTPIGTASIKFAGTFDGNGHTITAAISGTTYQGLFAYNNGTIKNLILEGTVSGSMYCGGIAGNNSGTIDSCINNAKCDFTGSYVGGIVGFNGKTGSVTNCINNGAVTTTTAAGFCGGIAGGNSGTVESCYNTGKIGNSTKSFAIMGSGVGTVTNCFYLEGSATDDKAAAKTDAEMKSAEFAAAMGDGFAKDPNGGYPVLSWQIDESSEPHEHTWNDGEVTKEATVDEEGVMTYTCTVCGETKEESIPTLIPDCSVRVTISGMNSTFKVPFGKTLNIDWTFVNNDKGVPQGWQMLVNGVAPVKNAYGGYVMPENEDGITATFASGAVLFTYGKPESITVTPTKEECTAGQTVSKNLNYTTLTKEQVEFAINFVDKTTGETIGTYKGSDGTGYHASTTYGEFKISATSTTTIKNYVTKNFPGYRLYAGVPGNVDKQEIVLVVGEDGVNPKSVTMYVEVNHGTISDKHTQPVRFVCRDEVVLEKVVPLKNAYISDYTPIALDLSGVAEELEKLGFEYDTSKEYTVKCDNYTHSPDVTVIEVERITTPHDHIWNDGEVTKEATVDEEGVMTYTCTVCGETKTEAIPVVFPFEYTIENNAVTITKYIGTAAIVEVPAEIEGCPVTSIAKGAFGTNTVITEVKLPESVKSIGQAAFTGCSKLEKINLEAVTEFAPYTFLGCSSLDNVVLNDEITTLPVYMFSECSSLSNIKLPAKLTALSNHLFDACESLKTLDIPESVTLIDRCAFEEAGIETLIIPASVTEIGDYAFEKCENLTAVTLGENVEKMGSLVFWDCKGLKAVVFNDKLTSIPVGTFFGCSALESVTLGKGITAIESNAFKNCTALKDIEIGREVSSIGENAFAGCTVTIHGYTDSTAFTYAKANEINFTCIEHSFGDWEITKEASCGEKGIETRTCPCGEVETREIAALEHTWNDGEITKEAAVAVEGEKTYTCTVCGEKRTEAIEALHFDDVKVDAWYHDAVHYCTQEGLFNGVTATTFAPNAKMTRAMFVTVLYRMAGSPDVSGMEMPFTDVKAGWAYDAIVWAYNNGITNGMTATTFAPNAEISRAQLVTMLYRAEGSPAVSGTADFADTGSFAAWSADAIAWASANGIVNGYEDNTFKPNNTATRAEMATVMYNMMKA